MGTVSRIASPSDPIGQLSTAQVVANEPEDRLLVRLGPGGPTRSVRLAASLDYLPGPGDEVLLVPGGESESVVISVLQARAPARRRTVRAAGGAAVVVDGQSSMLRVYSDRNQLVFEYDSQSGKARVITGAGGIEFSAPEGDLRLSAAGGIHLDGRTVDVNARSGLRLGVRDGLGRLGANLALGKRILHLQAAEAALTARRGEFNVEQTRFTAARALATVGKLKLVADSVEAVSRTVIEKTRDAYRSVQGVCQLQAGRVRTLVAGTYHMKSRQTILKSDDDIKVDADRIHLG